MRIVLSEAGKSELFELKGSVGPKNLHKINNSGRTHKRIHISTNLNANNDTACFSSFINIKQTKITIPRNLLFQYAESSESLPAISPKSPNSSSKLEFGGEFTDESVAIKDIIDSQVVLQTVKDLEETSKLRRKHFVFKAKDFRSKLPNEAAEVSEFKQRLSRRLGSEHVGLINYLKNKPRVNFKLVNAISKFSEQKIKRLSKICQKMEIAKEMKEEPVVESEAGTRKNKEAIVKLNQTKRVLDQINKINKKIDTRIMKPVEFYEYRHRSLKRTWEKLNISGIGKS